MGRASTKRGPTRTSAPDINDEQLVVRARAGDSAAARLLVERHLPLVRSVAARYCEFGLPFDDLVQEGSIGLLGAIERFDPERGAAFPTFARWRIRRAITHALTEKGHLLRLPKHVVERRRLIETTSTRVAVASGHHPSQAEVAAATGLAAAAVADALDVPTTFVSLDEPFGDEGAPLEACVADTAVPDPAEEVAALELHELLVDAVAELQGPEGLVVRRHYGLGAEEQSLADIAGDLHLSMQKTQAIKDRALYHLARRLAPRLGDVVVGRPATALRRTRAALPRVVPTIALIATKVASLFGDRGDVDPPF
ncbi:MAG TPA: sigma-70 family RNA polymerase sigma factor [Gaiellaceae bacterium]|nr:sigma-70 family RNA polymerase sigma factor [Gaiellaceae bacterium]